MALPSDSAHRDSVAKGDVRIWDSLHEVALPDAPMLDTVVARDLSWPDLSQPDLPQPDLLQPDLFLPDIRPSDTVPPPDSNGHPELQVFILAGQSNMVGLGYNSHLTPGEAAGVPDAAIYYFDGVHTNPNSGAMYPLGPGFGVNENRFGPELGFGHRLRQLWPGRPFVIIKVAEGATALYDVWAAQTGSLYLQLIAEVQGQLAAMSSSWQPRLAGLIWMQGESDGMIAADAAAYQGRLSSFITAVRQDLGAPGLPVVAGLISPHPGWPYADQIRAGTAALTTALPPMEVVETADLSRDPEEDPHYDSAGSLTLGRRFAEAAAAVHASEWHLAADLGANQYVRGWSYRHRLGNDVQPMSYDITADHWAGNEPALLIGRGWMHPGPTRAAELVWRAPGLGLMQVNIRAEAGDNGGGDGTWVEISRDDQLLWGPQAVPNSTHVEHQLQVLMQPGEELRFRTSAGPANDQGNDTTLWQVDIVHSGP